MKDSCSCSAVLGKIKLVKFFEAFYSFRHSVISLDFIKTKAISQPIIKKNEKRDHKIKQFYDPAPYDVYSLK